MGKSPKKILADAMLNAMARVRRSGKKVVVTASVTSGSKKAPRNAACPCGSGVKAKKCCGSAASAGVVDMAKKFLTATRGIPQTVTAMLNAGTPAAVAYAYYHTADYVCEENRPSKSAEALAIWDAHVEAFNGLDIAQQERLMSDIVHGMKGGSDG